MHIAGRDHAPGRSDAYLRFLKISIIEANRTEHRSGW
jgi:hypothetical protein